MVSGQEAQPTWTSILSAPSPKHAALIHKCFHGRRVHGAGCVSLSVHESHLNLRQLKNRSRRQTETTVWFQSRPLPAVTTMAAASHFVEWQNSVAAAAEGTSDEWEGQIERREGEGRRARGCCSQFVRETQRPPELQPASLWIPGLATWYPPPPKTARPPHRLRLEIEDRSHGCEVRLAVTTCRRRQMIDSLLILSNRMYEDEEGGGEGNGGQRETEWWWWWWIQWVGVHWKKKGEIQ